MLNGDKFIIVNTYLFLDICYAVLSQIHYCHNLHTFLDNIILAHPFSVKTIVFLQFCL